MENLNSNLEEAKVLLEKSSKSTKHSWFLKKNKKN